MRLNELEIKAIKETIAAYDSEAHVYLFGSRTDDSKLGGDIDLIILSQTLASEKSMFIKQDLYGKIGFQRIDILIEKDDSKPFIKIVLKGGIRL